MNKYILNFGILTTITSFLNSSHANLNDYSRKTPDQLSGVFLPVSNKNEHSFKPAPDNDSGEIKLRPLVSNIMVRDSLELGSHFEKTLFLEAPALPSAKIENENLDIDQELKLESWMFEIFEFEKIDKEMDLEEWMLEPFISKE